MPVCVCVARVCVYQRVCVSACECISVCVPARAYVFVPVSVWRLRVSVSVCVGVCVPVCVARVGVCVSGIYACRNLKSHSSTDNPHFFRQPLGRCDHWRGWVLRHMPAGFAVVRPRSTTAQQNTSHRQQTIVLRSPMAAPQGRHRNHLVPQSVRPSGHISGALGEPATRLRCLLCGPLDCEEQYFAANDLSFVEKWSSVVELLRNRLACDATSTLADDRIVPVVVDKMRIVRR